MADKLIFITGVSSGLGQALAKEALTQGWRVVGTVRSEEARKSFEAKAPGQALRLRKSCFFWAQLSVLGGVMNTISGL